MNIAAAKAALAHLDIDENPVSVKAKSRDFFWYSPVLKARLDHVTADFVVAPRNEAEVIEVLRVAHAHDVPVTVRGAGTGNYGQAMPLAGGIILHMKHMNAVKSVHPGRVIVEPGCLLKDVDVATKPSGRKCACSPPPTPPPPSAASSRAARAVSGPAPGASCATLATSSACAW